MLEAIPADQPIAFYTFPDEQGISPARVLRVAEIRQTDATLYDSINACAEGVSHVVRAGWRGKFEPDILSESEIMNATKNPYQQEKAVVSALARKTARYFITSETGYEPVRRPEDIRAVLRVEQHRPKLWTINNLAREPYPVITDLETRSGKLVDGEYAWDALALMRQALRYNNPVRRVAANTERENPDGIDFFQGLGFRDRKHDQRVVVGRRRNMDSSPATDVALHYVHMEAKRAVGTQDTLRGLVDRYTIG